MCYGTTSLQINELFTGHRALPLSPLPSLFVHHLSDVLSIHSVLVYLYSCLSACLTHTSFLSSNDSLSKYLPLSLHFYFFSCSCVRASTQANSHAAPLSQFNKIGSFPIERCHFLQLSTYYRGRTNLFQYLKAAEKRGMEVMELLEGSGFEVRGCWGRRWMGSSGVSCFTFWKLSFFPLSLTLSGISVWSLVQSRISSLFIQYFPLNIKKKLHVQHSGLWMYLTVWAHVRVCVFILPPHDYLYANSRYICVRGDGCFLSRPDFWWYRLIRNSGI